MSTAKHIFLVGMPGSGKSTLGRLLAKQLELSFYDLDAEIEAGQQRTIAEIFAQDGEEAFRKIEAAALLNIIDNKTDFILAAGGGTPCFYDGMKVMQRSGATIYLNTALELLIKRTKNNQHRPLLGDNQEVKIKELFFARQSCYAQANYQLDTTDLELADKAEKIVAWLTTSQ